MPRMGAVWCQSDVSEEIAGGEGERRGVFNGIQRLDEGLPGGVVRLQSLGTLQVSDRISKCLLREFFRPPSL